MKKSSFFCTIILIIVAMPLWSQCVSCALQDAIKNHRLEQVNDSTYRLYDLDGTVMGTWVTGGGSSSGSTSVDTGTVIIDALTFSGASKTEKINNAIAYASDTLGGGIVYVGPGIHEVISNPNESWTDRRYSIRIRSNVRLILDHGCVIKLADDQEVGTGLANSTGIIAGGLVENVIIEGGKIDGNASGQSTWTGGYAQVSATIGVLISQVNNPSWNDNRNVTIRDMEIYNTLANPLDIQSTTQVRIDNVHSWNCGEGQELIRVRNGHWTNVSYADSSGVAVGDALECSECYDVILDGFSVYANQSGAGGAVDFFGGRNIKIKNGFIDGWNSGVVVHGSTLATNPGIINWEISNIQVSKPVSDGLSIEADNTDSIGQLYISNYRVDSAGRFGAAIQSSEASAIIPILDDCWFTNSDNSGILGGGSSFIMQGGGVSNSGNSGIRLIPSIAESFENSNQYNISGVSLINNTGYAIFADWQAVDSVQLGGTFDVIAYGSEGGSSGYAGAQIRATNLIDSTVFFYNSRGVLVTDEHSPYVSGVYLLKQTGTSFRRMYDGHDGQIVNVLYTVAGTADDVTESGGTRNLSLIGDADTAYNPNDVMRFIYDKENELWHQF